MKAIDRRLRWLEERLAPQENEEAGRLVALLRERRRRRAEASGEPFEERPCEWHVDDQNGPLSVADILRMGRRRAATQQASAELNAATSRPRVPHLLNLA